MKVTYTEEAIADIVEAISYFNERNPTAAANLDDESSDAWLIESFVKSAPIELLRSLTAKILGYALVMQRA